MTVENVDPIGLALKNFYETGEDTPIDITLSLGEDDQLLPSYFFRTYEACNQIEKTALDLAHGKVLDVGAGAGSHGLHLQQKGLDVTAIDISLLSTEIMRKRGLQKAECVDFFQYEDYGFDTILMLMNGVGLVKRLDDFPRFFKQIDRLLSAQGQVLLDSSDLIYMFEQDDGSYLIELSEKYYGEVVFDLSYKNKKGQPFEWLYISQDLLIQEAERCGFAIDIIQQGEHFDYLARLTKNNKEV